MIVRYSKKALKFLAKQNAVTVSRIREGIQGLTQVPPVGDIKQMQGRSDGMMRLRVGGYRILFFYSIEEQNMQQIEILMITEIGNRGDIYK